MFFMMNTEKKNIEIVQYTMPNGKKFTTCAKMLLFAITESQTDSPTHALSEYTVEQTDSLRFSLEFG